MLRRDQPWPLSTEQVHKERVTRSDNWHSKFQRPDRDATLVEREYGINTAALPPIRWSSSLSERNRSSTSHPAI